jgi:hypothetical protein
MKYFFRKKVLTSFIESLSLLFLTRSQARFLPQVSPYHPIRPHQQIRRNRQVDLLGRFEIYHEFALHWLLDRSAPGLLAQSTLWKAITIPDVCGSKLS